MQRLAVFMAALWWGGISSLSFLAVPTLFAHLGAPVAGPVAGEVVAPERLAAMQRVLGTMGFVLAAMLLALLQEFGVAQKIVTARATGGNLQLWHGVGTLMVLGQWISSGALLFRLSRPSEVVADAK